MAVALEVRCPLLDRSVADLAGHVPPHLLMPGNRPKGLLRRLAAEHLPPAIVRRPKRGFAVPIGHWFRHELKDALIVNPYDTAGVKSAMVQAVEMDPDDARRRMQSMRRTVARNDATSWARQFLAALARQ